MTTQEKLERIKTRCQELLEIAEKRTPGKWKNDDWNMVRAKGRYIGRLHQRPDNDFIASCAGRAEAGWRATIAAIEWAAFMDSQGQVGAGLIETILEAWPDELL